MTENCEKAVLKHIKASKRGSVFTPSHFSGLGSRDAIDKALSRLTKSGDIRRIARGIYDYPVVDLLLGELTLCMANSDFTQRLASEKAHCNVTAMNIE